MLYGGLRVVLRGFLFQGAENLESSDVASLLQGRGQTRQPPFRQIFLDSGPKVVAVEYPLEPDPGSGGNEFNQQTVTFLEVDVVLVFLVGNDVKLVDSSLQAAQPSVRVVGWSLTSSGSSWTGVPSGLRTW